MINNINLIKSLLNFKDPGDFYILSILKRKKDNVEMNKSSKTIKDYIIENKEYLDEKYFEIIQLCEIFKARAYITIDSRNNKDVSLDMMIELATRIKNNVFDQKGLFISAATKSKRKDKRWVVDIDTLDTTLLENTRLYVGENVEQTIPTKNGYHLITKPFNVNEFKKKFGDDCIEIKKSNPTLLYYPNSITQ